MPKAVRPLLVAVAAILLVAHSAAGTTSRSGGTLLVATPLDVPSLDPAVSKPATAAIWYATCATLMAFPDKPAPEGLMPRPEAAAGPPEIRGGGRTYIFRVRRGLR